MMMQLSAHSATRKAIAGALAALTLAVSGCANSYGTGRTGDASCIGCVAAGACRL